MKLTIEIDYAFRIIEYLIGEREVAPASAISEAQGIPLRFTLRILRKLNLAGLTVAKRGTKGGYILKKNKEEISFYDVIVAVKGPIQLNCCMVDPSYCNIQRVDVCGIHEQLERIQENLIRDFKGAKFYPPKEDE